MNKLYDIDPRKEALQTVAKKALFIGMDKMLLLYSLGGPTDINYSDYGSGTTEQRIYDQGNYKSIYVYTDTDGSVSSFSY